MRPRPHIRRECGPRFPPLLHTSYRKDCPAAPVDEGVSSGCYVLVRRPITALDCVLLKDRTLALVPRLGPKINSRACLWVSQMPRQVAQCWLTNLQLSFFCISHLETPRAGSGPRNPIVEPPLASSSAISLPHTPACPGTQNSPTACQAEISDDMTEM